MGLKNLDTHIWVSVTGTGSNIAFSEDGVQIPNGLHLISAEKVADIGLPKYTITAKTRQATLDAKTGILGKAKRTLSMSTPQLLANGRVIFNTIRLEMEVHPMCPIVDETTLRSAAAQLIATVPMEPFWQNGNLS